MPGHLFCRRCGIKSFYQPRSHPGSLIGNLRALEKGHGLEAEVVPLDGRDWERTNVRL